MTARLVGIGMALALGAGAMSGPAVAGDGGLDWAHSAGGSGTDIGNDVTVDSTGVSTTTGGFSGTATFGTGSDQVVLSSQGESDIFVARYRADGTLLWVRSAGGSGTDSGAGVAIEGNGAATVTCDFSGTATFGTGSDQVILSSAGDRDMFVAHYRSDGTLAWARSAGGSGMDLGNEVAVDVDGSSTITGFITGTAIFGTGSDQVTLTSAGSNDIFVARYRPDGTLAWAQRAGGSTSDVGFGVSLDGAGVASVTGTFTGTATFGIGSDQRTLTATDYDVFVARYRPDGALIWVRGAGGSGGDFGYSVASDAADSSAVTGIFSATAIFGTGTDQVTLTSNGVWDIFLARYRPDGTLAWAQSAGGSADDFGRAVAVDSTDSATITGHFNGTATFGSGSSQISLTAAGGPGDEDVLLAQYRPDGSLAWAQRAGGTQKDYGLGVAIDAKGRSTVTGGFNGTATFGTGSKQTTLTSAGQLDVFLASYSALSVLTSLAITPTVTATTGTQACVTTTAKDQYGQPMGGVNLSAQITGANPGSANGTTGADGTWKYCYIGNAAGVDTVTTTGSARAGAISASTTITWTMAPVPPTKKKQLPIKARGVASDRVALGADGMRVLTKSITTNKHGKVKVRATCRAIGRQAAGEVRFCKAVVGKRGKVTVRAAGSKTFKVTVIARATPKPGATDWRANTWRNTWRVRG